MVGEGKSEKLPERVAAKRRPVLSSIRGLSFQCPASARLWTRFGFLSDAYTPFLLPPIYPPKNPAFLKQHLGLYDQDQRRQLPALMFSALQTSRVSQ